MGTIAGNELIWKLIVRGGISTQLKYICEAILVTDQGAEIISHLLVHPQQHENKKNELGQASAKVTMADRNKQ